MLPCSSTWREILKAKSIGLDRIASWLQREERVDFTGEKKARVLPANVFKCALDAIKASFKELLLGAIVITSNLLFAKFLTSNITELNCYHNSIYYYYIFHSIPSFSNVALKIVQLERLHAEINAIFCMHVSYFLISCWKRTFIHTLLGKN